MLSCSITMEIFRTVFPLPLALRCLTLCIHLLSLSLLASIICPSAIQLKKTSNSLKHVIQNNHFINQKKKNDQNASRYIILLFHSSAYIKKYIKVIILSFHLPNSIPNVTIVPGDVVGEMDIDVSDEISECSRFDITNVPISVTVIQVCNFTSFY